FRADVARRFFAADVLLPRLKRVHETPRPARVMRFADDATRHLPNERGAAREDPEIGSPEAHGDPKGLPLSHHDVDAERARRLEQRVRVRLRHLYAERARSVGGVSDGAHVDET